MPKRRSLASWSWLSAALVVCAACGAAEDAGPIEKAPVQGEPDYTPDEPDETPDGPDDTPVATQTVGSTVVGDQLGVFGVDDKAVNQVTFGATSDVEKLIIYIDGGAAAEGSASMRGVIYAAEGGGAGGLLAQSGDVLVAAGTAGVWRELVFSTPVRLAAGAYWIGVHVGGPTRLIREAYMSESGAMRYDLEDTFADGPESPFGPANVVDNRMSLAAVYRPVSGTSAPTSSIASGVFLQGVVTWTVHPDRSFSSIAFVANGELLEEGLETSYSLDTRILPNGANTLSFRIYAPDGTLSFDSGGIAVVVDNPSPAPHPTGSIDAADILAQAQAGLPFAEQEGYTAQVIGTYTSAPQIPESGIHGTTLPSGETLRFGKQIDPLVSTRGALAFAIGPNDPKTSGSMRNEIKFPSNIEMEQIYWAAFSLYVYDWGSLPSSDIALMGIQLHEGGTHGLSPSVQLINTEGGRDYVVSTRGSSSSTPTQSNSFSVKSTPRPIEFGQWVDFVFKVKLSWTGEGFLQAWADGEQIMSYQGVIGYNTPDVKPYFKFGYYNWTNFASNRKILLRSPVVVADFTEKYEHTDLQAYVSQR